MSDSYLTELQVQTEIKTDFVQEWSYETDEMEGVCIIAKDTMQIRFRFEAISDSFYDVLKIDEAIRDKLKTPVSVEGMADYLHNLFPKMTVTALGRAASHGWISATIKGV